MKRPTKSASGAGRSVVAAEIVCRLDPHAHSFAALMRLIRGASDSVVTAALSELLGQNLIRRFGGKFQLSNKGFALVTACKRQRRPRGGKK
jgi:hypothetical protein